jgi:hypothetical protein
MIAFPANIKRRIKVNCDGGVRQWPQWFPCEKGGDVARGQDERLRVCKNLQLPLVFLKIPLPAGGLTRWISWAGY